MDNEYIRLKLKKGRNLLLIKMEQSFGGWGFIVRRISEEAAWKHAQEKLDVAMAISFYIEDEKIMHVFDEENPLPVNAVIGDAKAIEIVIRKKKTNSSFERGFTTIFL